ncbi:UPF0755 protein [Leifsonia sp. AK011]|uniref:endolytic transglycosylase MltG n=1 Tax=Leifsonia sp. AK011 TaxID=2723075 RepID=UPI0015C81A3D|nr:endolytic transglycosylase MltG [Leifsonia sp. AK011]NYF10779.1 UPF0755 protein [Leifsonia sp. AK011]
MANEPSWEDIFQPKEAVAPQQQPPAVSQPPAATTPVTAQAPGSDPLNSLFAGTTPTDSQGPASSLGTQAAPAAVQTAPSSRRALRETEGRRRGGGGSDDGGSGRGRRGDNSGNYGRPPRKRRLLWLWITLPIVLIVGGLGGVAAYGWANYEEQIRELMGWQLPNDYTTAGNGVEVIVPVRSGDIGADVAKTLHEAGVTMTFDAVYDYLVENPDVSFIPGNWRLQEEMSAESAVSALQDPANKVTSELLLTEGSVLPDALEIIAETTGIPLEEVQAAAADPTAYGVPAEAPSLEGYLFPATYELSGSESAQEILQLLVNTMFEHLDAFGVAPEQRHEVLTKASIIQREAGWNIDDFYKVARVFQNRIDQGINLESDATVAYGTGNLHTVWTTDAERADASNPYNTYANPGLPIGPIGLPGDDAISAALNPADGPWLFFVPINLATGETVFSETVDQHEAAAQQLRDWCQASEENAAYCG